MIKIEKMTLEHFDLIKENLQNEFDDFWTPNVLKSELESINSGSCKYWINLEKKKIKEK